MATFKEAVNESTKDFPLVLSDGRLIFMAVSDYNLLLSAAATNQNQEMLKVLLSRYLHYGARKPI